MAEERISNLDKFAEFFKKYGGRPIAVTDFKYNEYPNSHVRSIEIRSESTGVSFIGFGVGGVGLLPAFFSTFTGTFEVENDNIILKDPEAPIYKSVSFKVKEE
jgi:hypothetical protein